MMVTTRMDFINHVSGKDRNIPVSHDGIIKCLLVSIVGNTCYICCPYSML